MSKPVNPFTPGGASEGKEGAAVSLATPTTSQSQNSSASASSSSSSTDEVKSKPKLPSFWVPSLTPDAKPTEIKKPVSAVK